MVCTSSIKNPPVASNLNHDNHHNDYDDDNNGQVLHTHTHTHTTAAAADLVHSKVRFILCLVVKM